MVAYSFKKRFAAPIEAGIKGGTIRADRKRHAYPGEAMQLYVSQRTAHCRLLGAPRCISINPIALDWKASVFAVGSIRLLHAVQLDLFAKEDGFTDLDDMRAFWAAEHPGIEMFLGIHLRWDEQYFARRAAL